MKIRLTRQEFTDLLNISTRNAQMLGNAIKQNESMANIFDSKKDDKDRLAYLQKIHILKLKQKEELGWVNRYATVLNHSSL